MGRQACLARDALGRSYLEEPERDDEGNVRHLEASIWPRPGVYVQQYNDRGRPQDAASELRAATLRHAKNDVLSTAGVVVRKDRAARTPWQRQTEKQKMNAVIQENDYGLLFKAADQILAFFFLWWIIALRRRFQVARHPSRRWRRAVLTRGQVFASYSTIPLPEVVRSEVRIIGVWRFLTCGMLAFSVDWLIDVYRDYILEDNVGSILSLLGYSKKTTASPRTFKQRSKQLFRA